MKRVRKGCNPLRLCFNTGITKDNWHVQTVLVITKVFLGDFENHRLLPASTVMAIFHVNVD